ncbi:MAG: AmmeMemoRadiSam system protein A [bacterium]
MYLTPEEKKALLRLARASLDSFVSEKKELASVPDGIELTDRIKEPAGVFVTLEKNKELRGCIGYIEPVTPLYKSVMEITVSACSRDYRFPAVEASELDRIEIEVSVLTPKQEIKKSGEFIPGKQGVIIEKQGKRAVFLPQVAAEQGWNREETFRHLCIKAGLPTDAWKKGARFWVFTAEVFGE